MAERDDIRLAQHMLAALVYRARAVLDDAPSEFGDFDAGSGVRTPLEIVDHMTQVIRYVNEIVQNTERDPAGSANWPAGISQFYAACQGAAEALGRWETAEPDTVSRLVQGPISDAMTHVGQLAMLRRMMGAPVIGQNFFKAEISTVTSSAEGSDQ